MILLGNDLGCINNEEWHATKDISLEACKPILYHFPLFSPTSACAGLIMFREIRPRGNVFIVSTLLELGLLHKKLVM